MHTAQALLTMLGAHHDVPKHQANHIGIPNGIPVKKQNQTFLFKSLCWKLCSDYPGPPLRSIDKTRPVRALSFLGFKKPNWHTFRIFA
jgi:hypothetical protein